MKNRYYDHAHLPTCLSKCLAEMYKSIRFNEKELAHFALSPQADKEGLLEKKGAGRGQG